MIRARLIEDYIRDHPGTTFHDMTAEFGYRPSGLVNRLEKMKRVYWLIDLKDGKTKHFYSRKEKRKEVESGTSKQSKKERWEIEKEGR